MIFKIFLSALIFDESIINHLPKQRKGGDSQGLSNCTNHNKSHVTLKKTLYC